MTERLYTEAEMNQVVDREIATIRMGDIEKRITAIDNKVTVSLTEIKEQIKAVMEMIEKQSDMHNKNQKEFKEEIEKEFATKSELKDVSDKIDGLTSKMILIVSTVTCVGLIAKWLIEFLHTAGKI